MRDSALPTFALSNCLQQLMFTDYVNGGEMFTHLYQRETFSEDEVRIYVGEIVLALETLHKVSHSSISKVPAQPHVAI